MALYIIGFVSYGATLVFYAALFPRLARNTPHARALREKYENGEIKAEEYEKEESLEKNRISNISTVSIPIYVESSQGFRLTIKKGTQQHWLHCNTVLELIVAFATCQQPEGR